MTSSAEDAAATMTSSAVDAAPWPRPLSSSCDLRASSIGTAGEQRRRRRGGAPPPDPRAPPGPGGERREGGGPRAPQKREAPRSPARTRGERRGGPAPRGGPVPGVPGVAGVRPAVVVPDASPLADGRRPVSSGPGGGPEGHTHVLGRQRPAAAEGADPAPSAASPPPPPPLGLPSVPLPPPPFVMCDGVGRLRSRSSPRRAVTAAPRRGRARGHDRVRRGVALGDRLVASFPSRPQRPPPRPPAPLPLAVVSSLPSARRHGSFPLRRLLLSSPRKKLHLKHRCARQRYPVSCRRHSRSARTWRRTVRRAPAGRRGGAPWRSAPGRPSRRPWSTLWDLNLK